MEQIYLTEAEIRKLDGLRDRVHDTADRDIQNVDRAAQRARERIGQAAARKKENIEKWRRSALKKLLEAALRLAGKRARTGTTQVR
jgi:hypothetical protein